MTTQSGRNGHDHENLQTLYLLHEAPHSGRRRMKCCCSKLLNRTFLLCSLTQPWLCVWLTAASCGKATNLQVQSTLESARNCSTVQVHLVCEWLSAIMQLFCYSCCFIRCRLDWGVSYFFAGKTVSLNWSGRDFNLLVDRTWCWSGTN